MDKKESTLATSPCWKYQHEENMKQRREKLSPTSISRANTMANECRSRLIQSVQKISSSCNNNERRLGILLSGGVDSCAILAASQSANVGLVAAVTISIVDDDIQSNNNSTPQDELYAIDAARIHNESSSQQPTMKHSIIRLSPHQLIKQYTRPTIETLALWGYMEVRNSLIISAALDECHKLGLTDVLVGDNADELFGGSYDVYFHEKYINDPEGWKEKRDSMADLPFVTQKIAAKYKINIHQPFSDQEIFVKWALAVTTRDDCISKCSIQSKIDGPYELQQNCGKLVLREAFCTRASWRRMDWIFAGSGASNGDILLNYYDRLVSDDEFKVQQEEYQKKKNVKLQTKEHLHNIKIYESIFGGLVHPTKARFPVGDSRGCVSCCFEVDEDFCHLCDQYPARQQAA